MDTYLTRAEDELLFHDFYTLRFPDLLTFRPGGTRPWPSPYGWSGRTGCRGSR